MSAEMALNEMSPVAFLSYAHLDDCGAIGEISFFHDRLQNELRMQTGLPVHIFFDKKSIGWGKRWSEFINSGLEGAAFLIPILTPSFFRSDACRDEYKKFVEVEKRLGRRDLVLPIYYVKCREFEKGVASDHIVRDILSRQYRDWRENRHRNRDSMEILRGFADLAASISDVFFEIEETASLDADKKNEKLQGAYRRQGYFNELLDREISYESLVTYFVETWPKMPVSPEWTRELLSDINRERYKTLRDIDIEVKYAKDKVLAYAKTRPDLFAYSTDFVTKSLIFSDSEFRRNHSASPDTLAAARSADIAHH